MKKGCPVGQPFFIGNFAQQVKSLKIFQVNNYFSGLIILNSIKTSYTGLKIEIFYFHKSNCTISSCFFSGVFN